MSQFIEMFGDDTTRKSLCEICRPKQWPTIQTKDFTEDGYLVYGANGVIGHYKEYNHKYPTILMACRGASCGAINVSEPESYITGNAMCLDDLSNEVCFEFLVHFLTYYDYKTIITGGAQPQITITSLQKIEIPIPPKKEQEKFVAIARQADKSEFGDSKSQFIEMFGEKEKNIKNGVLGDFCSLKAGKSIKAEDIRDDYCDGLYPCYGGNGLRGYVSSYSHEGVFNIIGRQGALCGNVTITSNRFYATEHAVIVTPKEEINTYWLFYALKEMNLNQYARGVAQPGLAVNQLEKIPFGIPSLVEQDRFETIYNQADKSEYELRSKIDAIDNDIKSFINENMKRIEYRYTLGKNTFIIMDGSICKVNPIFV